MLYLLQSQAVLLPLVILLLLTCLVHPVNAAPPQYFQSTPLITTGLNGPSGFEMAPDGRVFILQRTGEVKIFKNGNLLSRNFVTLPAAASGDRGLIGIAFDPNFAVNKHVYFYYTSAEDLRNYLVRFSAETDIAQNGPVIIYQTPGPSFQLHVGGGLIFGDDGKLYLGIGDNGYGPNSQNKLSPYGKILRLNKDGSVPADNPFVNSARYLPEIYSLGLRNPWRLQKDPSTGKIYVSDVGANDWEEINLVSAGKNFGWPVCEGLCGQPGLTDPFYTYGHFGLSSAVTMGPVYQGEMFPPQYRGKIFFADYARGFIRYLSLDASGHFQSSHDFDMTAGTVVDLKQVYDGSIYYLTYFPGRLYRISYSETSQVPVAVSSANVLKGLPPLVVQFSSAGSFDPDSENLDYFWDFGDGSTSSLPNPVHTYAIPGAYTVELTVSDGVNQAPAIPLIIQVGISPILTIGMPPNGATYKAGDIIAYSAHAVDGVGNDINDSSITTEVIFHHDTHIHPFLGPVIGRSGSFQIPHHGEPDTDQWYEIIVTATDQTGLSTTKSVGIYPQTVTLKIDTVPAGLTFYLEGKPRQSPSIIPYVINYQEEIEAPITQMFNGKEYTFYAWSSGRDRVHTLTAPSQPSHLTAYYYSPQDNHPFLGEYFPNRTLSGSPTFSQTVPEINFDWGFSSPHPSLPVESFSARWTGTQFFPPGVFRFTAVGDDGIRLYIDGNLVIDKWIDQGPVPHTADVYLSGGDHRIVYEYFESGGQAISKLSWSPSPVQFFPTPTPPPPPASTPPAPDQSHFTGEFFANKNLAGAPVFTSRDPVINFDWGDNAPNTLTPKDNFSVRWSRLYTFTQSGTYRFTTSSDDGVRLFVNNQLVIDKWLDQSVTSHVAEVFVNAGTVPIVLEYYDGCCSAVAKLSWALLTPTPSPPSSPLPSPTVSPSSVFTSAYYPNKQLAGPPVFTDVTPTINYHWGDDAPNPLTPKDNFSVRWLGDFDFPAGVYRFYSHSDDGVRLYVAGRLIIDKWIDQSATTYSAEIALSSGLHPIIYEFFDGCCTATARLWWEAIPAPTYSPSPSVTPTASPTPTPDSTESGFSVSYYTNTSLSGPPVYTGHDPAIRFDWGDSPPHPLVPKDKFSARWQSRQAFSQSGTYRFTVTADDGVRLWVGNDLLIDKWLDQSRTTYIAEKFLNPGIYPVTLEYYDNCCSAVIDLSWQFLPPASPVPTPTPPPASPSPTLTPPPAPTPVQNMFSASYFDNQNLLGAPVVIQTTPQINYDWGFKAPDAALPPDSFSGRFEGHFFLSGPITFTTTTDDGVRFYIDDELVIDNWRDQPPTSYTYSREFPPGVYSLKMEYFESGGIAIARLNW